MDAATIEAPGSTPQVKPRYIPNDGKGRPPGIPNKIHVDVKKLAQSYGPDAIRKLAEMGGLIPGVAPARPNATQAYALDKLLDRAYGKAPQAHSFEGEGEILGVVIMPSKRPAGTWDNASSDNPSNACSPALIEGAVVRDAEVVAGDVPVNGKPEQAMDVDPAD